MRRLVLCGEMEMNCYFLEHNNKCYIVDPGYEKEKVIKYVNDNKLKVLGILLTHGHPDHIGAIDCFKVPVYIHKDEYQVLVDSYNITPERYGRNMPYSLEDIDIVKIDESAVFSIDDKKIHVIHTPGHTIGGVCYKFGNDLCTGDTLFKEKVGKWIFKTGDLEAMKKSVVNLINTQPDNVNVYPGHYDSSTIGHERRYNDFYLKWK